MIQEELADTLALSSIHVNRTLKLLSKEELVVRTRRSTRRSVKIIDWHALTTVGDFDSSYLHLPEDWRAGYDETDPLNSMSEFS